MHLTLLCSVQYHITEDYVIARPGKCWFLKNFFFWYVFIGIKFNENSTIEISFKSMSAFWTFKKIKTTRYDKEYSRICKENSFNLYLNVAYLLPGFIMSSAIESKYMKKWHEYKSFNQQIHQQSQYPNNNSPFQLPAGNREHVIKIDFQLNHTRLIGAITGLTNYKWTGFSTVKSVWFELKFFLGNQIQLQENFACMHYCWTMNKVLPYHLLQITCLNVSS